MMPCLLCYWNFPYCKKAEHLALLGENIEYLTQHEPAVLLLAWSLKSPVQIYTYSYLLSCGRVSPADRISSLFFISCVWHNTSNFLTNLTFLRSTRIVDLPKYVLEKSAKTALSLLQLKGAKPKVRRYRSYHRVSTVLFCFMFSTKYSLKGAW